MCENTKYGIWKCEDCGKINYSIPKRHHDMNYCTCGQSAVDLETYGCRYLGAVNWIKDIDYNFFDEILLCYKEQRLPIGYHINTECGFPITVYHLDFIKDLEDEMIQGLIDE